MKPRMKKTLGALGLFAVAAALVVTVLVVFFDLRLEMTGARWGGVPTFVFFDQDEQWRRLEKHRREQATQEASHGGETTSGADTPETAQQANTVEPLSPAEPTAVEAAAVEASGDATSTAEATAPAPASATSHVVAGAPASDWPSYRGAAMDGIWRGPVSLDWPDGPPVLYRQPLGVGYASFVAGEGLVFTIEQRRGEEVVAAYEPMTGAERWTHSWPAMFEDPTGDGPRATPTYAEGRLVALGALGDLVVLEASTGRELWRAQVLDDAGAAENATWGMAGSPLVVDGLVVVQPGGARGSVLAYALDRGDVVWRALDDGPAYTAPMVATLSGARQIVAVTAKRAVGLSIADGALLWEYPWETRYDVNAAQPIVVDDDRVFLSAGYDHGAALFRASRTGDSWNTEELWLRNTMKNQFSSSVLWEGHVYGFDNGILACVDVETGERRWKGGRYGHGQLLLTEDGLVVLTEKGELAVVELTPEAFRERSLHPLLDGKTWNVPAITGGLLLVRNAREMAVIDIRG